MKYENSKKSVPEIAAELGVDAIIEGSVLRAGSTVRVTVQLIDGSSDRHLWADNFDREMTDILALYADVTREIVNRIRVEVTPAEAAKLATHKVVDPAAYELYLKGNYFCGKWAPTEMLHGIELMRQAVRKDPDSAVAHAGLAICLQYASFFDYLAPLEILPEAVAAAERAVELDEQLAEAWVSLAAVNYYLNFDGPTSERALERALEINPSSVRALNHYSWQLGESGRFEEGLVPARRAIRLDPLSTATHLSLAQIHYLSRENETALRLYEQIVDMDRHDPSLHFYLGWAQEQSREYDKAILSYLEAIELSNRAPLYVSGLGHAYGIAGRAVEAQAVLEELVQQERDGLAQPFHVAVVHLGLKNYEEAIDWLEKSFAAHNAQMMYIKEAPQFDPLRSNERFTRLVDRMR
jgi:tetratricopeptide (TPR) repeat protein